MAVKRTRWRLPGPKALLQRDRAEVYEYERSRYVRCVCGHLKRKECVCEHCFYSADRLHPIKPDPSGDQVEGL